MDLLILGVLRSATGCVNRGASKGTAGITDDVAQAGQEALWMNRWMNWKSPEILEQLKEPAMLYQGNGELDSIFTANIKYVKTHYMDKGLDLLVWFEKE